MFNQVRRNGLMLGYIVAGAALAFAGPNDSQGPEGLARARLDIARKAYEQIEGSITNPPADDSKLPPGFRTTLKLEQLVNWSRRWMETERDTSSKRADQIAALDAHRKRLKKQEDLYSELLEGGSGQGVELAVDTLKFHRLEAEYWLAKAKAER
jgi:hypothetical protein